MAAELDEQAIQKIIVAALKRIKQELQVKHVLDDHAVTSIAMQHLRPVGLEMDSIEHYIGGLTLQVEGKHYLNFLEHNHARNDSLTSTRNLILEIILKAPRRQVKKSSLVKEVLEAAQERGVDIVGEDEIKTLIDNICQLKPNKHYTLK